MVFGPHLSEMKQDNTKQVQPSARLGHVPASPIRKLVPLAQQAKKKGIKVYHLNIGDPDIPTPEVMVSVLHKWQINPIGYDLSQGNPKLIAALRDYYHGLGHGFVNESDIQVTTGGSEAISMAMFAVAQQDEEILVFEPFYANYNSYAAVNGIRLVPVRTRIGDGFHLPGIQEIEKHITAKTRAVLLCNPNNPTGTVYTAAEIERIVALSRKYGLFILSDEVYREYVYDGKTHVSLLSYMERLPDRTVVLDSLSKRYSLCGARVGAIVSRNQDIMTGILRIAQGRLSSGLIDQAVAAAITSVPESYMSRVFDEYVSRREVLYQGLKAIPGTEFTKPEGAFYTIVGLPVENAEDFCRFLLTGFSDNRETVMLAPASGFYATPGLGRNEVRIAYILNSRDLQRSVELLRKALAAYKH